MTALAVARRTDPVDRLLAVGVVAGVLAMATAAVGPRPCYAGYAMMSTEDFKAWVTAIAAAVSAGAVAWGTVLMLARKTIRFSRDTFGWPPEPAGRRPRRRKKQRKAGDATNPTPGPNPPGPAPPPAG